MGKLFGTDGIRGIVGENLTVELRSTPVRPSPPF